ncbi:MAG: hypothetical protein VB031_08970 [Eubacteriaceae bacterium]|nr:hypothetical protein [Eubacteriaceae bacterium]
MLKARADDLCSKGNAERRILEVGSSEHLLFDMMTKCPEKGQKIIGKGEAAAIALARAHNGILASNNLSDIAYYVEKYDIKHITTADILVMAVDRGIIETLEAESFWRSIKKHTKMPEMTFMEYMEK